MTLVIKFSIIVCALAFSHASAQAQLPTALSADVAEEYNLNPPPAQVLVPLSKIATYSSGRSNLIYSNGPLVTNPGAGFNGNDISVLQLSSLGMSTFGFGAQYSLGYRIADDFIVDEVWEVGSIKLFGYQTGAYTGISTFTGGYLQIWDGAPNDPGSNIIWGDLVTNRMISTSFVDIFRVTETNTSSSDRAIMEIVCETPGLVLNPGTYWIDFSLDGTGSSGPWHPPITILGQTVTGNALQYTGSWASMIDSGTSAPQGATFEIYGLSEPPPVPVSNWALYFGILLMITFVFIRFRRLA